MLEQDRGVMESESTVMTSLVTPTSSEFSTKASTPTTSLDYDVELQPQIRILRRYCRDHRASSASPPSTKRRAATMQNGIDVINVRDKIFFKKFKNAFLSKK